MPKAEIERGELGPLSLCDSDDWPGFPQQFAVSLLVQARVCNTHTH